VRFERPRSDERPYGCRPWSTPGAAVFLRVARGCLALGRRGFLVGRSGEPGCPTGRSPRPSLASARSDLTGALALRASLVSYAGGPAPGLPLAHFLKGMRAALRAAPAWGQHPLTQRRSGPRRFEVGTGPKWRESRLAEGWSPRTKTWPAGMVQAWTPLAGGMWWMDRQMWRVSSGAIVVSRASGPWMPRARTGASAGDEGLAVVIRDQGSVA
jgi:hypothetical protein